MNSTKGAYELQKETTRESSRGPGRKGPRMINRLFTMLSLRYS